MIMKQQNKTLTEAVDHRAMAAARDMMIDAIRRADRAGISSVVILGNGSYSWRNVSANGLPNFIAAVISALSDNRVLADIVIRSLRVVSENDAPLAAMIAHGLGDIVDGHRAKERKTVKE